MIVEPDHAGGDTKMNRMEERYDILVEELKEDGIDLDLVFEDEISYVVTTIRNVLKGRR